MEGWAALDDDMKEADPDAAMDIFQTEVDGSGSGKVRARPATYPRPARPGGTEPVEPILARRMRSIGTMCGLTGILTTRGLGEDDLRQSISAMSAALAHRGPDDSGEWVQPQRGLAFGFRRLSIVDLTPTGHQPMVSASRRYTIVFNGMIYNYRELRAELAGLGARFVGGSDTEVILAALEAWGIDRAVRRLLGMFAIAVWDAEEACLHLVRDRMGVKPMFVYHEPGLLTFASELKALVQGPSFDNEVDVSAVRNYLTSLYVPAPMCIYRRSMKLPPGSILTIRDAGTALPDPVPYWCLREVATQGLAAPFQGGDEDAVDELERHVREAVECRRVADVPLGALLSGGIDSSTVVAMLQRGAAHPIRTFSVAFEEEAFNEADHAAEIAAHLGTDHQTLPVTGTDALDLVPRLSEIFDEPHADTSQIPAFLICALAREHVTVALSGDGGDEVLGGYNRYTFGEALAGKMTRVPWPLRRGMGRALQWFSPSFLERAHGVVQPLLPGHHRHRGAGGKLHKVGGVMRARDVEGMYLSLTSPWPRSTSLLAGADRPADAMEALLKRAPGDRLLHRMMFADQSLYLPDDQLAKVDRVSMAVGLEARVPLVDHRLVEFSWRLPPHYKIRDGRGKWLLREVLYRQIPRALVDRPKMGLSVPIDRWLTGPLRDWSEELLSTRRLAEGGILDPKPIRRAWDGLLHGRSEAALGLWAVLLLQDWRRRWAA